MQTGDLGGATEDLTLECNWFGGGGWTLNIRGTGATVPKNTKLINNVFSRDHGYGPWTLDDPDPVISGNTYEDGAPIEPGRSRVPARCSEGWLATTMTR